MRLLRLSVGIGLSCLNGVIAVLEKAYSIDVSTVCKFSDFYTLKWMCSLSSFVNLISLKLTLLSSEVIHNPNADEL